MKSKLVGLLVSLGLAGISQAVVITASGGTTGAQFVTSVGTLLTSTNASIEVGSLSGNIFTQFAVADLTQPAFGAAGGVLAGRWTGNATDNNNVTASPFNSAQIWFKVTTTADGGGVGYYGSSLNFPVANAGVGDSLSVPASSLSTVNTTLSTDGVAAFQAANGTFPNGFVTIGVIPEPSAALLGALGALGLLRRRRI